MPKVRSRIGLSEHETLLKSCLGLMVDVTQYDQGMLFHYEIQNFKEEVEYLLRLSFIRQIATPVHTVV